MQNTHMSEKLKALHGSLIDIVTVMNQPQRDEVIIRAADIKLDRALFPLLVGIQRVGPIGVVELADRVGRDYTTVSRQVAKLEALGLIERSAGAKDKRIREAVITPKGRQLTDRIDAARERIGRAVFGEWEEKEFDDMVRLMRKLADAMLKGPPADV